MPTETINRYEALAIAERIGVDWGLKRFGAEQFRMGLDVELGNRSRTSVARVTDDDLMLAGKIALDHLNRCPDYYTQMTEMKEGTSGRTPKPA